MIDNNLEDLVWEFKIKAKVLKECMLTRYPNFTQFETLRTRARQLTLMATGHTWTLNSMHIKWLAVDWVFDVNGQPSRDNSHGQFYFMQRVATMCGMMRIAQEVCHTQDNWVSIKQQMINNSTRYIESKDPWEQQRLKQINDTFRKYWFVG